MRMTVFTLIGVVFSFAAFAKSKDFKEDLLIKYSAGAPQSFAFEGTQVEQLAPGWVRVQVPSKLTTAQLTALKADPTIEYIQPNYTIHLLEDYRIQDPLRRAALAKALAKNPRKPAPKVDNPPIPLAPPQKTGADPDISKQWGMIDIGAPDVWKQTRGNSDFIVAVIDTGVDYTHEDLLPNLWRNPGESGLDAAGKDKSSNGIDDDNNGYVDDVIGYDFASNDNKPFDLSVSPEELLVGGGNPGHGTHCAGNVAARGDNGIGISGVAPNVKIMGLRFITEKGSGKTSDAIRAVRYAVDNGAKVLSNSWGSEGEDPQEGSENKALRDVIQYAQDKGVLFVAAAGNGHQGQGYDNDTDPQPGYPASYDHENIVSVAAIDAQDALAPFSNWGAKSVDIGAPGVAIYSTVPGNNYEDHVINMGGFEVTWDGTSMATPHVAGAAALYWSTHPEKNWKDVKAALLTSAKHIPSLAGKTVSNGKLDVKGLFGL